MKHEPYDYVDKVSINLKMYVEVAKYLLQIYYMLILITIIYKSESFYICMTYLQVKFSPCL